jgi:hypothetical protein
MRLNLFIEAPPFVGQRHRTCGAIQQSNPEPLSSRLTARLTPESVMPISSAAFTKLPPSTTAAKMLIPDKFLASNAMGSFLIFNQEASDPKPT